MRLRWLFVLVALILPAAAFALTPVTLCNGQDVEPMPDGRMLGHLPYVEADPATLVTMPGDFGIGRPCQLNRDAAGAMTALLAAADKDPQVKGRLRGVSCFRSVERQRQVFCGQIGPRKRCKNAADRARSSGPPGYSEHATGYALDFGIRPLAPKCGDVSDCIARTPPGKWLLAHAPEYGFELSFPPGNAQGVTWEPWHWRWVGINPAAPGAATARACSRPRARASPPAPRFSICRRCSSARSSRPRRCRAASARRSTARSGAPGAHATRRSARPSPPDGSSHIAKGRSRRGRSDRSPPPARTPGSTTA